MNKNRLLYFRKIVNRNQLLKEETRSVHVLYVIYTSVDASVLGEIIWVSNSIKHYLRIVAWCWPIIGAGAH